MTTQPFVERGSDGSQFVYVFVDESNFMTAHNLRVTGSLFSAVSASIDEPGFLQRYLASEVDFLPFIPNPNAVGALSPFTLNTINNYRVEYEAETIRRQWYKDVPSRLTAVFAFERWEDCMTASAKHGWPLQQVRRFRVVHALRVHRLNMEIISVARVAYRFMLDEAARECIWRSYWEGEMDFAIDLPTAGGYSRQLVTAAVLPELLIDGRLGLDRDWQPPST